MLTASGRRLDLAQLLLGRPMRSEEEAHERLGKPTALAVFASDNLSSSAYATEEILRVLAPVVGLGAFALVAPLSLAMVGVLALLVLSYRQTIKEYPTAGGAYIVTRDNFGLLPAQVAGTALLTDYVLTVSVSVSVAAGVAALTSAFAGLIPYRVPISVGFIAALAYGNLRGVRESAFVARLDESVERAMRYVASIASDDVHTLHIGKPKTSLATAFEARYGTPLAFEPKRSGLTGTARRFVRGLRAAHPDRFVAAVVPEVIEETGWVHLALSHQALRLKAGLLCEPGVSVINVPTIPAETTLFQRPAQRHVVLVPLAGVHAGSLDALAFARRLRPFEVRAVHFQDEEESEHLVDQWEEMALDVPLDVVGAPYRQIDRPLVTHVRNLKADGADLVTVVIGELVLRWWQQPLHNHRALEIKAALLFEPGVAVASVPYHLAPVRADHRCR